MTLIETIQPAPSPNAITLERRYANREDGIAVSLDIAKEDRSRSERYCDLTGRFVVRWNARSERGWRKGWVASFDTRPLAEAFAAAKWTTLKGWAEKQPEATARNGAADCFSAQVASMRSR
jgi:hypothetical protein